MSLLNATIGFNFDPAMEQFDFICVKPRTQARIKPRFNLNQALRQLNLSQAMRQLDFSNALIESRSTAV